MKSVPTDDRSRRSFPIFTFALLSVAWFGPFAAARDLVLPEVPANWQSLLQTDPSALQEHLTAVLETQWDAVEFDADDDASSLLAKAQQIFALNAATRQRVDALWKLSGPIGASADSPEARPAAATFLKTISAWVDFSGRLRFATREHTRQTVRRLPRRDVARLIGLAQQYQVGIVAPAIAFVLAQPPATSKVQPFDHATRMQLVRLIQSTHEIDATASLYELLRWPHTPDALRLHLLNTLRTIGISQASLTDSNRLTPAELLAELEQMKTQSLSVEDQQLRIELMPWLASLAEHGVQGATFRWGPVEIQAGDWVLQRNPSPYNRFTDLSPGLFTHVGIAAEVTDNAGIRRIVIVDLPETGTKIEADTADEFVSTSLHWVVLRHRDPKSAAAMGRVAAKLAGRTSEFDLTFNTALVHEQRGIVDRPDDAVRTYCAGFLALCAQEAGVSWEQLFPLVERPINDRCGENLESLGLTMTEFLSPSGPLFSPDLQIVGARPPMYAPDNQIREAVYDQFARRISEREFQMHETSAQRLRQQLAELSSDYSWVRAALAQVNDVSPAIDLVVAGRVATIVENLDAIADTQAEAFSDAMTLVTAQGVPAKAPPEEAARLTEVLANLKSDHPQWFADAAAGKLSNRQLQQLLTRFYSEQGQVSVDAMFFPESPSPQ
ncbi:hypothetical protein Poly24_14030 [Rosistilla carotiformis]|uniref:Uncharacterized protein n=1 Tax=Rosistilla carotiformis TaxID=2528017 RepID=A0A518JQ77_9BACT|nr:hypothetical protein [Rosistilla carotiformis]QDV67699.1 hypothetical protein Poly24_14030 [Rosistilla carotiformis]